VGEGNGIPAAKAVAAYVRVSTVEQNEAGQRAEITRWLTGNGIGPTRRAIQRDDAPVAYRWGDPPRLVALDDQTHLQPQWVNRSKTALKDAEDLLNKWLETNARPLTPADLYSSAKGYKLHTIPKGGTVNYAVLFQAVAEHKMVRVELQDPYLLSHHQRTSA
jgi:hypothetical protein